MAAFGLGVPHATYLLLVLPPNDAAPAMLLAAAVSIALVVAPTIDGFQVLPNSRGIGDSIEVAPGNTRWLVLDPPDHPLPPLPRSYTPSDPRHAVSAASLLTFFGNLTLTPAALLFGHHNTNYEGQDFVDVDATQNRSDVLTSVGKFPGLVEYNLAWVDGSRLGAPADFTLHLRQALARGAVPMLYWQTGNPVTHGNAKDLTGSPITAILPGGTANAEWIRRMKSIAAFVRAVQKDLPFVFRPFHECTGGWFWWGARASTPAQYRAAFNYTVSYLRENAGLRTMLIAYAPSKPAATPASAEAAFGVDPATSRYPGDSLVDVACFDNYGATDDFAADTLVADAELVARFAAEHGKVPAICETGRAKGVQNLNTSSAPSWWTAQVLAPLLGSEAGRRMAFLLTWRNSKPDSYWVPLPGQPAFPGFTAFAENSATLFAGDFASPIASSPLLRRSPVPSLALAAEGPCPAFSGKGCASCVAAVDSRCPSKWCGQPCVHASQPIGRGRGGDCFPANWWASQHSKYPKVGCTGNNATGCKPTCGAAPSPAPPSPPGPPPPPPGPLPPADVATAVYLTDYPQALCLDGSPGYFYIRNASAPENASKWVFHLQGGGWCSSNTSCFGRTKKYLGSSKTSITNYTDVSEFGRVGCDNRGCGALMLNDPSINEYTSTWNAVFVRYCDGMAFSASAKEPMQMSSGEKLWFRGLDILRSTFAELSTKFQLGHATEVKLNGASAGGHATYLHADTMADWIYAGNKAAGKPRADVMALPDSGFWPDDPRKRFSGMFRDWFALQGNGTQGLPKNCKWKTTNVSKCLFPENFADEIETRLWPIQSLFDPLQHMANKAVVDVNAHAAWLLETMNRTIFTRKRHDGKANGGFIHSCTRHCGAELVRVPAAGGYESGSLFTTPTALETAAAQPGAAEHQLFLQQQPYPCKECCNDGGGYVQSPLAP